MRSAWRDADVKYARKEDANTSPIASGWGSVFYLDDLRQSYLAKTLSLLRQSNLGGLIIFKLPSNRLHHFIELGRIHLFL
jgi:hypothetical protein